MAKSKTFPSTDTGATEPKPMTAEQHAHFQWLVDHTIDNTVRAGHGGHMLGKAGPGNTGHDMPKSDAHMQGGAYMPQGNRQNTFSDNGSDDASTSDYGKVDKNG